MSQEDRYLCENCGAVFENWEALHRDFGGEIGVIVYCPRCKTEITGETI
jgi:predicted amidophosphoribosyltransferase